jgi:hypothetical protein
MTNQQAQFVLHAYRPNGADAADATFGEALEQTRRDPALAQWFAAQQRFDRAVSAQLAALPPPAGLREAILAGARASRGEAAPAAPVSRRWLSPTWLALAASLALVATVSVLVWPKEAIGKEALLDFAITDMRDADHEGRRGSETAKFQALLGTADARLGRTMPVDFARLRADGCRTVSFRGKELLEVCFERNGQWFHCYVAQAKDFPQVAARLATVFRHADGITAGAWRDGEHIFIVASTAGREAIERLI